MGSIDISGLMGLPGMGIILDLLLGFIMGSIVLWIT